MTAVSGFIGRWFMNVGETISIAVQRVHDPLAQRRAGREQVLDVRQKARDAIGDREISKLHDLDERVLKLGLFGGFLEQGIEL
jgi:hypothetical protein